MDEMELLFDVELSSTPGPRIPSYTQRCRIQRRWNEGMSGQQIAQALKITHNRVIKELTNMRASKGWIVLAHRPGRSGGLA